VPASNDLLYTGFGFGLRLLCLTVSGAFALGRPTMCEIFYRGVIGERLL